MKTIWLAMAVGILTGASVAATPEGAPATSAATASALVSKAFEKDGLRVVVKLDKEIFASDEHPKFTVMCTNTTKQDVVLDDLAWIWTWKIQFEDLTRGGAWEPKLLMMIKRSPVPLTCKAGETVNVAVDFAKQKLPFEYRWAGDQDKEIKPMDHLKPGKYRLTMEILLLGGEPGPNYWSGTVKTEPVEFEISEKAKP